MNIVKNILANKKKDKANPVEKAGQNFTCVFYQTSDVVWFEVTRVQTVWEGSRTVAFIFFTNVPSTFGRHFQIDKNCVMDISQPYFVKKNFFAYVKRDKYYTLFLN